ncbi:MAG: ABC transporter substrate-binding protein [Bacteroidales bacterium]|nr:ABC transporter substrate-binding protein [Bacteroidales bacterium]MCM1414839.1 ABC transporter substrate-binding protein [bacterium]MCM1422470.1 ABC transporter substrate-binding protein [bacterium]
MKLKKVLAVTLAAAMTFSLAACGGNDGSSAETAPAAEETPAAEEAPAADDGGSDEAEAPAADTGAVPNYLDINLGSDYTDLTTTIKFIHCRTDREEDGTMADIISRFNQDYPNITVETDGITDYAEDALLRLSAGGWGDVMWIPAIDTKELSTYFLPYGTVDEMSQEYNFVSAWSYDGISYGLPVWGNAQGVVYNKAVFEAAGITSLPTTPTEFLEDLQKIKDNTDAIPLYTNYAAGWTMGAWDAYVGVVSNGDNTYMNQKFAHTAEPFKDPGDDSGAYNLYRILYDAVANGLIEDDYTTTDWEGCKGMINRGEIGAMVLGSWAFSQMVEADEHGDDVGYMPFPMTVGGTQYVLAGGDYNYAINKDISDDNKIASMVFIKWMLEKSDWNVSEGCYSTWKGGTNPDMYSAFDGCTMLSDEPAVAGEEDLLGEINAESELSFNAGGDAKVQGIVEAAATGSESFDEVMASWTEVWNAAQDELGIEVNN